MRRYGNTRFDMHGGPLEKEGRAREKELGRRDVEEQQQEPLVYHPPPNQEFTVLALYRKTFRGSELLDWADPRRIQEEARLRDMAQTLRQKHRGWIIRLEPLTFGVDQGRTP